MSFKEQLLHIANNMKWVSSAFLFSQGSNQVSDTATLDKASIIKVLSDAYDEALTAHYLNENSWAKAIAMMRHGFGGHPFGEDDHIKKERAEGQIEGFYINDKN